MRFRPTAGSILAVAVLTAAVTLGALYALPLLPWLAPAPVDPAPWPAATSERLVPRPADPVQLVTIVAVGDLMVHTPQLLPAKTATGYDFTACFAPVASRIGAADLAIGNLETVLAGPVSGYTGYPTFNSPDAYAQAAIGAGFDVLTTANNHTLDRGAAAIPTTLDTLDRLGALHTGTARTQAESESILTTDVAGVKVAVLAYTYGMNGFSTPEGKGWMVNTINQKAMESRVRTAREAGADLVIVSIHNGVEYQRQPSDAQVKVEKAMVEAGADVVLGSHPHVIQPMETVEATRADGSPRTAFIIHSLGNFLSNQRERYRDTGLILRFVFEKNLKTKATSLARVEYVPVWVDDTLAGGKAGFRVLPVRDALDDPDYEAVTPAERQKLVQAWNDTTEHLGGTGPAEDDPGAMVFYTAPGRSAN
jgi:poly-gamma-glutamate synthesis protein (capsule biosynthesis protein)